MSTIDQQYLEITDYIFNQLPAFSKYGKSAINNSLDKITALCDYLGNPEKKIKTIHIAGTNGKGSTSHMLAAILQSSGYNVALYTSPHVFDFRERIKINGENVSKKWVIEFTQKHKEFYTTLQPSFFEVTVAMAFAYFAEQNVDIAIIETGLGGRLDSTNIIQPILSIITNISYDHTDLLGDTLSQIAHEKAGIIKPNTPFIIGEKNKETEQVFFEHSIHKKCSSFYADAQWGIVKIKTDEQFQYLKAIQLSTKSVYDIKLDLLGTYQIHNLKTVLTATILLNHLGYNTTLDIAKTALSEVKKLTGLRARWEQLKDRPKVFIDVAHNKAGITEVLQQWHAINADQKHIVIGFVKDKDVAGVLKLFPKDNQYYFCNASIPRALPSIDLKQLAEIEGLEGNNYSSVSDAVKAALSNATEQDSVLITGSFFIIAEAYNQVVHF
jgi:dihydrofolate synthase/folylpolyglutamate synthase